MMFSTQHFVTILIMALDEAHNIVCMLVLPLLLMCLFGWTMCLDVSLLSAIPISSLVVIISSSTTLFSSTYLVASGGTTCSHRIIPSFMGVISATTLASPIMVVLPTTYPPRPRLELE